MRYLYRRGRGARKRVMHLCGHDPLTGDPTMIPLCGLPQDFDTTINVPLGKRTCRRCLKKVTANARDRG
jgi:hypothetical protein